MSEFEADTEVFETPAIPDIELEKDAFETNEPKEEVSTQPTIDTRPEHIEIGNTFDNVEVDPVLVKIAETNQLDISWEKLQRILDALVDKQCTLMEEKIEDQDTKKTVEALSTRITQSINEHSSCPFTIQRLCELVIEPKKYYKMYIKYLRAVEKVLSVTSYWEEYVNSNDSGTGDKATLLPTFSVEVEPHNFSTATTPAGEESAMEDVDNTVVESKVEQVTKEEDVMEDITKEEVSKEEADVPKTETKPDDDAKMDLD